MIKLTEDNFLDHALNHYDNPQAHSIMEFEEDVKRFLYLKKLFSRYKNNGELRERLILNHIIVLYNLFNEQTTNMLFHKIDEEYWNDLTTFLVYLNRMPNIVPEHNIKTIDIILNEEIIKVLREI